jgi:hypothetical protein
MQFRLIRMRRKRREAQWRYTPLAAKNTYGTFLPYELEAVASASVYMSAEQEVVSARRLLSRLPSFLYGRHRTVQGSHETPPRVI